jgi:hypothetical protein
MATAQLKEKSRVALALRSSKDCQERQEDSVWDRAPLEILQIQLFHPRL